METVASYASDTWRGWASFVFGVFQYTLVFRQTDGGHTKGAQNAWSVIRPAAFARATPSGSMVRADGGAGPAHMFAVPICSALALEGSAYEHFLIASGALEDALGVLTQLDPASPTSVETARRQIQSLVMAAEVRHIVDSMPA